MAPSSTRVDTRVPTPVYDALCRMATANKMPLAQVVREALEMTVAGILSAKNGQPRPPAAS